MKNKLCPIEKEKKFVDLSRQREDIDEQLKKMKSQFRKMALQGYDFRLIRINDNTGGVFSPPWKQLCFELLKKFMPKQSQQKAWMRSVMKRFPRQKKEASVSILKTKEDELVNA